MAVVSSMIAIAMLTIESPEAQSAPNLEATVFKLAERPDGKAGLNYRAENA
jgi:hypothetical protein